MTVYDLQNDPLDGPFALISRAECERRLAANASEWRITPEQLKAAASNHFENMAMVGRCGERYMFMTLFALLPNFSPVNWVGAGRANWFGDVLGGPLGGERPYDFDFIDAEGLLCGERGARCLVEVKSTPHYDNGEAWFSELQMELARRLYESDGRLAAEDCDGGQAPADPEQRVRYVFVRVEGLAEEEARHVVYGNPWEMKEKGHLVKAPGRDPNKYLLIAHV